MTNEERNEIIAEDFNLAPTNPDDVSAIWYHKYIPNLWLLCPTDEKQLLRQLIFLKCTLPEFKDAIPFGVKFVYNAEDELMTLITALSENQG